MSEEEKKNEPLCKECVKKINQPRDLSTIVIGLVPVILLLTFAKMFYETQMEKVGIILTLAAVVIIVIEFAYYVVCNIQGTVYYAFLDKHDCLHLHTIEPQYNAEKKVYFSSSLIKDKDTSFDDMIIVRPILKFLSRGWFSRLLSKNEILGVRNGKPDGYSKKAGFAMKKEFLSSRPNDFSAICTKIEFNSRGAVFLTPWLDLERAINLIQSTEPDDLYIFLVQKDLRFVDKPTFVNMKEETKIKESELGAIVILVNDAIKFLLAWRGSEQSKVGMGCRYFLQTVADCFESHRPKKTGDSYDSMIQSILDNTRLAITEKTENNKILQRFIEGNEVQSVKPAT